ncbi:hypothetical protein N7501_004643 [Penicillium viridicatum]|nr:hypothetical protein N7501_004643 [Penicillium viridicatum]
MSCTKPSSWMKDTHDLPKTVPLFAIIYSVYLFGQLLVGFVTHRQKLKKIGAEKIEKCPKCTDAQSRDDAIQSETARVAARELASRAENLTLELGNSVQRAAEAEQRALEAERRLSGWNFKFLATVLEPLSDPASARLHRDDRVHTRDSSRLGQLLRSCRGLERSDSLESGKIVYGTTQKKGVRHLTCELRLSLQERLASA